jgi:hypothetical protein
VREAVRSDCLQLAIGEQWKGVAGLARQIGRLCRRVDADGERLDAGRAKLTEMFFDTP